MKSLLSFAALACFLFALLYWIYMLDIQTSFRCTWSFDYGESWFKARELEQGLLKEDNL